MLSATPELLVDFSFFARGGFTPVGESVYFSTGSGGELWITDGTQSGTQMVASIQSGGDTRIFNLVAYDDQLVFVADGGSGLEPWISDGTLAGTMQIKDINPSGSSFIHSPGGFYYLPEQSPTFYEYQGELYFSADDGTNGYELWRTDGTEAGTVLFADIKPGAEGSYPGGIAGIRWVTSLFDSGFVEVGGTLYFGADTVDEGFELWKTDGTETGTNLVKDIRPGNGTWSESHLFRYRDIRSLVDVNGTLFFTAADGDDDFELWKSDGTEAGTVRVKDILPGPDPSYPLHLTAVDDALLFFARSGGNFDLWNSDGTEAGTVLVKDFGNPDIEGVPYADQLTESGGTLFFSLDDGIHGRELWKSDGTEAGTVLVADIRPGAAGSEPLYLTAIEGGVAFVADDGIGGIELWVSDGTEVGTQLVADLIPGSGSSEPRYLTYAGGKLYFSAVGPVEAGGFRSVWAVDISLAPVADAGGPYSGSEGDSIVLSAANSTGSIVSYEWDLDNDGQYDDAVGENVNFNATDNGVFTIGLRINGAGGPTDSTTVTVNNVAPTAGISGTTAIYRGEEVTFTLTASDASPVDQAGLFNFEIDWDGNGTVDETLLGVPSGTTVQHAFPSLTSNNIQVRATDKDADTGSFGQTPITVTPHVLRDDGFGNTDLIWGGTSGLDAVYVLGQSPALSLFVQLEGSLPANRIDNFGSTVTGKIILHGYDFADVLVGQFSAFNVVEIHGGEGDDVIVGGSLGDVLYGDGGNDTIIGGTQAVDGDDMILGGEGRDTLFGHIGADTLDGGGGEDLLISDRFSFSNVPAAVQQIANEWKSARPYSERMSNILGVTSTGVNGLYFLEPNATILDDGEEDVLLGGIGDVDWFFYDFDQDLLGDTIEVGESETDSEP